MITNKSFYLFLFSVIIFLKSCRPPLRCIENKSNYFKSTRSSNSKATDKKVNTFGTYVLAETTNNGNSFSLIKLNANQTVQVSQKREKLDVNTDYTNNNYLNYLSNQVTYYYYFDTKSKLLTLERFEYWDAPWWNFFVQTNHYLVEKFSINGDTLRNEGLGYTRFGKTYVLDRSLTKNFDKIDNEYILDKNFKNKAYQKN